MAESVNNSDLSAIARKIRRNILQMLFKAQSGHPGGSLSCVELLTYLYFKQMRIDPKNPNWTERDRFILSKGHGCPALYAVLSERGYFPEEELWGLRQIDRMLQGHPDASIPGIETPSGSLGMGLSVGCGMALSARYLKKDSRTFVILGDGDMEEGETWEAIMYAGYQRLCNITAILDCNLLQGEGPVEKTLDYRPVEPKVKSFHWDYQEIDGHNFSQIEKALHEAGRNDKPTFILARTIKGKGISFMENQQSWHGSKGPNKEELEIALKELL